MRAGVRVSYQCEPATYRRSLLKRSVGERGTILIQGGGNLGDVYRHQHRVRELVLRDFPRARVIQLPQSVWFETVAGADRFRRLAEAHQDFTLMVRDTASLEWAEASLDVPRVLCPDLAFALGALERAPASRDVLWLMRGDRESHGRDLPTLGPNDERFDWRAEGPMRVTGPRPLRLWLGANGRIGKAMNRDGRLAAALWRAGTSTFGPIARGRLAVGVEGLSRGRVVITDRLHGHVLALLMGIPHVLLDNTTGKCRSFWNTWTSSSPLASWADDPGEALAIARAELGRVPGGS